MSVDGRDRLQVSEDIRSCILESAMRDQLPSSLVELGQVNGLASCNLALHHHLMKDAFLKEALGLYQVLLDTGILDELFPYLIGGEGTSLV